jgi:hypothetical protein
LTSCWKRPAVVAAISAIALAGVSTTASAKCRSAYCGSYHGSTQAATAPDGHTSGGGPFGFVVNADGVVAVTANVDWWCFHSGAEDYDQEPLHVDKTFKAHPSTVKTKGKRGHRYGQVSVDKHFGDLHVSFYGTIKGGKFSGFFAVGTLGGGTGCGTATMPASAHK